MFWVSGPEGLLRIFSGVHMMFLQVKLEPERVQNQIGFYSSWFIKLPSGF